MIQRRTLLKTGAAAALGTPALSSLAQQAVTLKFHTFMLASAHKLAAAGADFLICPDNTIHQAFSHVEARSPLPWLHIAEVVAEEAAQRGFLRIGITGTRWLVGSEVYPDKLRARGLDFLRPTDAERDEINRIIMLRTTFGCTWPEPATSSQRPASGPVWN